MLFRSAMKGGSNFPPVLVFDDGEKLILADGFHRHAAAVKEGRGHILAEIRKGTRSDAVRAALSANSHHGLRLSNADKRRCVRLALEEFGKLSDRQVADVCGISHPFVGKVRRQLETVSSSPRLGKDGKERAPMLTRPHATGQRVTASRMWGEIENKLNLYLRAFPTRTELLRLAGQLRKKSVEVENAALKKKP